MILYFLYNVGYYVKGAISMGKTRAGRNRTIALSEAEINSYLKGCVNAKGGLDYTDSIIYGDIFDVCDKMPKCSVDLLIADPPYNLNKKYGKTDFKKMNEDEYKAFTNDWICLVKPLLKDHASIYICCDWKSSLAVSSVLQEHFTIQNRITWQREKGRGAKRNWKNAMEDIWFATLSPKNYTFNLENVKMRRRVLAPYKENGKPKDWTAGRDGSFRDTYPSNFWDDISIPYWSMPENTDHPTQKPEKLMAKLILASSNPDDMVFDPFVGSGTTAVTAKKLDRHFVGVESEGLYCALAQKRLEMAEKDKKIQGYTDGIFWERNTLAAQLKYKNH